MEFIHSRSRTAGFNSIRASSIPRKAGEYRNADEGNLGSCQRLQEPGLMSKITGTWAHVKDYKNLGSCQRLQEPGLMSKITVTWDQGHD